MHKEGCHKRVHIQKWAFITEVDADACQKEWKVRLLSCSVPSVGRLQRPRQVNHLEGMSHQPPPGDDSVDDENPDKELEGRQG